MDDERPIPIDEQPTIESIPLRSWRQLKLPSKRPSRRTVRILAAALLVVLLAVLVGVVLATRQPEIHSTRVKQGNVVLSIPTTGAGTLQSAIYDANFLGSGQVAEISVSVGAQVQKGQALAKLNTTQLQDAVNEAQAALTAAQTQLSDAQTNQAKVQADGQAAVDAAQTNATNAQSDPNCNASCQQTAQNQATAAQAQADQANTVALQAVDQAQTAVDTAQAKLQTAQDNLNGATLTAPHDGTISAINGRVGSTVIGSNATAPVTSFIQISDLGALQAQTYVSVDHAGSVAANQSAQITVPQAGSKSFGGKVDGISPVGKMVSGTLVYPVTIDVDMQGLPPGMHLLPGMNARARIVTQQATGPIIPASAVAFARAAGNPKDGGFLSKSQVNTALAHAQQMLADLQANGTDISQANATPGYVLQQVKGKWVTVPVVLGLTDGSSYIVLAGLSVGEQIVTGESNGPVTVPAAKTPTPVGAPTATPTRAPINGL